MKASDRAEIYYYSDLIYDVLNGIKNKSRVIFFSDKLDLFCFTLLIMSKMSEIPIETLLSGALSDQQWPNLVMATAYINNSDIEFISIKDMNNKQVEVLIHKSVNTQKKSLLLVDYTSGTIFKGRTKTKALIHDLTKMSSKLAVNEKVLYSNIKNK